jgi:hypothetical protein
VAPENQKTTKFVSSGTKGRYLPRCHPRSAVCRTHDRRTVRDPVVARPIDRRCPVSLALCAGAYWSSAASSSACASVFAAPRSVRGLPGPFAAAAIPARTSRRVSVMTHAGYSSRSMPVFSCGREYGGGRGEASSALDVALPRNDLTVRTAQDGHDGGAPARHGPEGLRGHDRHVSGSHGRGRRRGHRSGGGTRGGAARPETTSSAEPVRRNLHRGPRGDVRRGRRRPLVPGRARGIDQRSCGHRCGYRTAAIRCRVAAGPAGRPRGGRAWRSG